MQAICDLANIHPPIAGGSIWIPTFEAALPHYGWRRVSASAAVPGDFVILGDQDHIGIYEGGGMMISNGSTKGSFTWEGTVASENASYAGGSIAAKYWHHP